MQVTEKNDNWREMRQLIADTGLTQAALANKLGVTLRTVSALGSPSRSHGVNKLTIAALKKLKKR